MSDTSGDSSVGAKCNIVDTLPLDQNNNHSGDQTFGSSSMSESESDSDSSSEEDDGGIVVEETPMSERLGHADIFAMRTKMDGIRTWLRELVNDPAEDYVYVHKPTLRHHKRAMDSMRRCLEDAAPMAVKISQYMDVSVKKHVVAQLDKAIEKNEEPSLLKDIEQEVLKNDKFPHKKPSLLNAEIGEIVNSHLGSALLKHAQKQTEAKLLKKYNADTKKALDGLKEELKGAGLMK